jgi:type VI secretion system protein ImpB
MALRPRIVASTMRAMATNDREGSVAPKERVNIRYRSATDGAQEDVELPLRILMLGDFTGRQDERALEERRPVDINKENFAEVMAAQKLQAEVQVPNHVAPDGKGGEMNVQLAFNSLADFRPEGIVDQVKELSELKQLRDALRFLKTGTANGPTFIRKIQDLMKDKDKRARLLRELGLDESTT